MKKIIIYTVAFIVVLSSCKKQQDLPKAEINDPHFFVNCVMDGQPLAITAGDDDYYMNSSWFRQDSTSLYVYKANLAKQTGSGYQVSILINDLHQTDANGAMSVDSALSLGGHLYNDQNTSGLSQDIDFTAVKSPDGISSYGWSTTDGTNISGSPFAPDHSSYSHHFEVGKTYSVTLNYDDGVGNCTQKFTNVFKAGSKLQTAIIANRNQSAYPEFKYSFSYPPASNVKCLWEFDDNTSSTNPSVVDKVFTPGSTSLVKLTLTDKGMNESCVSYYQLNATNGTVCDANYSAKFSAVENIRLYSSVTVLLTDPNGVVYSSQNLVQPQASSFDILSVANYTTNEKGQATKRLKVNFNCIVKNGTKEINLKNGEAMIAVAYK